MTDLDENGILRWSPGDQVLLMCECVEQIDPETVRVKVSGLGDESTDVELDVPAHYTLYAGAPLRRTITFKRLSGFDNE